ncbi:MAG: ABC transporter ATP-binding protein [Chloroflexi bacterium]|nr:ABC transporter ATP-binding protein [Chloroflexota bacterium]MCC6897265.1 ABC transporter ATP-binding protein [Anaerolineae bacterium]
MTDTTTAIRVSGLHKQFGRGKRQVKAVQNLSLEVQAGQVYGFLGPNGAGKTTTIRMLLDLIRPTSGEVTLFGQPVFGNPNVLKRVGALVEGATFYPYLSGRQNLEVLARTGGYYDPKRVQAIIEQVGMADRVDRRTKGYSTGMKQRMGLAATLLGDPDLIILDEPTNGLDPAGIQEMRLFIRELADKQGKTVFLSSHMLNEIEQVCDSVAIINKGKLVREGTVKALLSEQSRLLVEADPLDKAQAVLSPDWTLHTNGGAHLTVEAQHDDIPHIIRKLVENHINIYEVAPQRQSLEAYFLAVTQGEDTHD